MRIDCEDDEVRRKLGGDLLLSSPYPISSIHCTEDGNPSAAQEG